MLRTCSIALITVLSLGTLAQADVVTRMGGAPAPAATLDGTSSARTATFVAGDFSGGTTITGVSVSVTVTPAGDQGFADEWFDLSATLLSPDGTTLTLLSVNDFGVGPPVGSAATFGFADGGTALAGQIPPAGSPYDPSGAGGFANFNGENAIGAWTLTFTDAAAGADIGDVAGSFDGFSITLTTPAAPVPEPSTAALLGLGLVGFVATRRRRGAKRTKTA